MGCDNKLFLGLSEFYVTEEYLAALNSDYEMLRMSVEDGEFAGLDFVPEVDWGDMPFFSHKDTVWGLYLEYRNKLRDILLDGFLDGEGDLEKKFRVVNGRIVALDPKNVLDRTKLSVRAVYLDFLKRLKKDYVGKDVGMDGNASCNGKFSQEHVELNSNIINISSNSDSVEDYISGLRRLFSSSFSPNAVNITTAIFNMGRVTKRQGVISDPKVVSSFLFWIADRLEKMEVDLNGQSIGNILYGLNGLNSSIVPRKFMDVLGEKIKNSSAGLSTLETRIAFCGLNNLDSFFVTEEFMKVLFEKITFVSKEWNHDAIELSLGYLYNLRNYCSEFIEKLFLLWEEDMNFVEELDDFKLMKIVQLYNLYGRKIPDFLRDKYLISKKNFYVNSSFAREVFNFLKKKKPYYDLIFGHVLDGFGLDIFIFDYFANIEIVDPSRRSNKNGCCRRDQYLEKNCDISVFRFDLSVYSIEDFDKWFESEVLPNLRPYGL